MSLTYDSISSKEFPLHTSSSFSIHLSGTTPAISQMSFFVIFVSSSDAIMNKLHQYYWLCPITSVVDPRLNYGAHKLYSSTLTISDIKKSILPFSDPGSDRSFAADCKVVIALRKSPSDVSIIVWNASFDT